MSRPEPNTPPPLPSERASTPSTERPAAWWAWPVIILSVLYVGWAVNFITPEAEPTPEEAAAAQADTMGLALLNLQSQPLIALDSLEKLVPTAKGELSKSFEQLSDQANSDPTLMALALLEQFIGLDGQNPADTLDRVSEEVDSETLALTQKAIDSGLTTEERESLEASLGWFSQLPPTELGEPSPYQKSIESRSVIFLFTMSLLMMGAFALLITGAIFLFLQLLSWKKKTPPHRFSPSDLPRGIMLEVFAIYLGLMAIGDALATQFPLFREAQSVYFLFMSLAVILPLFWPRLRGFSGACFRRSIGLHTGTGFWKEIGAGFLGYTKLLVFAATGILITLLLSLAIGLFSSADGGAGNPIAPQPHPIVEWIYSGGWQMRLFVFFLAAIYAPIVEEIFFRGALQRWLRGRFSFLISALISGVIFAALHPQGWMGIPALAMMGIGFSFLRESRDSLIAPMVAHAINNGILTILLCLAL